MLHHQHLAICWIVNRYLQCLVLTFHQSWETNWYITSHRQQNQGETVIPGIATVSVSRKTESDLDLDYPRKEPHLRLDPLQLKIIWETIKTCTLIEKSNEVCRTNSEQAVWADSIPRRCMSKINSDTACRMLSWIYFTAWATVLGSKMHKSLKRSLQPLRTITKMIIKMMNRMMKRWTRWNRKFNNDLWLRLE